jgi:hypothetical protein
MLGLYPRPQFLPKTEVSTFAVLFVILAAAALAAAQRMDQRKLVGQLANGPSITRACYFRTA